MVRHLPHLDDAILTAGRDDVVVVRAPGNVQDGTFVPADQGVIWVDTSNLKRRRRKTFLMILKEKKG